MEAAREYARCMDKNILGNMRLAIYTRLLERSTQTVGYKKQPHALCFGRDHGGISNRGMLLEVGRKELIYMDDSVFGNMRPTVYIEPSKRLTQTTNYVGTSMGTPNVAASLNDVTVPSPTISDGEGQREKETINSLPTRGRRCNVALFCNLFTLIEAYRALS